MNEQKEKQQICPIMSKNSEGMMCIKANCALWIGPNEAYTIENYTIGHGMCSMKFQALKNADGKLVV